MATHEYTTIISLLPRYQAHLLSAGQTPIGARTYIDPLRRFALWADPAVAPSDVSAGLILDYHGELAARGIAVKTLHCYLSGLRRFFVWCVTQAYLTTDPTAGLKWPRLPRHVARCLQPGELAALHAALVAPPAGLDRRAARSWERNRRVIYLMLFAGLRISEVALLRWEHIKLDVPELLVERGKGGHQRIIPINAGLLTELLRVGADQRVGAVCETHRRLGEGDNGITVKSLGHVFERWLPALGLEGINAHRLRHTFATELRRSGADLEDIRQLLGHEWLETTQIYLGPDPERLRAAVDRLPQVHQQEGH
jgi:integrase/recombinase XerD